MAGRAKSDDDPAASSNEAGGEDELPPVPEAQRVEPAQAKDPLDGETDSVDTLVNRDLHDVVALMEAELTRLKATLAYLRQADHPERDARIRMCIARIDEREDALEALRAMLPDEAPPPH